MKEQFIKRVRKSGTSLAINIPADVVRLLKIEEGNIVRASIEKVKRKWK